MHHSIDQESGIKDERSDAEISDPRLGLKDPRLGRKVISDHGSWIRNQRPEIRDKRSEIKDKRSEIVDLGLCPNDRRLGTNGAAIRD